MSSDRISRTGGTLAAVVLCGGLLVGLTFVGAGDRRNVPAGCGGPCPTEPTTTSPTTTTVPAATTTSTTVEPTTTSSTTTTLTPYRPAPQVAGDCHGFRFDLALYEEPVRVTFTINGVAIIDELGEPGATYSYRYPDGRGTYDGRLTTSDGFDYGFSVASCNDAPTTTTTIIDEPAPQNTAVSSSASSDDEEPATTPARITLPETS